MSQSKFEVGELVIMQNATYFSEIDGELATVVKPLGIRSCFDLHLMKRVWAHVYGVKVLKDSEPKLCCRPWQLRKYYPRSEPRCKKQNRSVDQNQKLTLPPAELQES